MHMVYFLGAYTDQTMKILLFLITVTLSNAMVLNPNLGMRLSAKLIEYADTVHRPRYYHVMEIPKDMDSIEDSEESDAVPVIEDWSYSSPYIRRWRDNKRGVPIHGYGRWNNSYKNRVQESRGQFLCMQCAI